MLVSQLSWSACLHYGVQWSHLACESPSNRKCGNVSYTNYTSENHSVNQTFLAENVRSNKEMGSYLANFVSFGQWPIVIFTPAPLLQLCVL